MEEEIQSLAQDAISARVFPGCVVGIAYAAGQRRYIPVGSFTYENGSSSMSADSIFDVASITKSIPTASLALQLIDEGKIRTEDPVIKYLPEMKNPEREKVLIKHLLTYTLQLEGPGIAAFKEKSPEEMTEYLLSHPFAYPPGTTFKYSNLPAFLMGLVLERVYGKPLDQLADEHFFKPLTMEHSTFAPERLTQEDIVPTEVDFRGEVRGIVHDESAYLFKTKGGKVAGHAGLFSTAPDLLMFLEMLLQNGEKNGKMYFSKEIIEQMGANQIPELSESTGLGWELNQPRLFGSKCGPHTFGKTGFTGTMCVSDIERGIAFVILTNRIYPKRPSDSSAINAFRAAVSDVVWAG